MLGHKVVGGLSWGLNGKESTFNAGNVGSILGRKDPLEKKMASWDICLLSGLGAKISRDRFVSFVINK